MNNHTLIKKAVKVAGSQKALADHCRVSQPAVCKWLAGKCWPTIQHAIAIEKATGGIVALKDLYPDIQLSSQSEHAT